MVTNLPLKIFLTLAVVALIGCYGIRCVVFSRIESKLPQLLQELQQQNIHASVKSIETSWYDNTISLKEISFSNEEPNSLPLSIAEGTITSITITGVELLPLLVKKNICLDSLLIGKVRLTKYKASKTGKKNKQQERIFDFAYIKIDSLNIIELDSMDKTVSESRLSFETKNVTGSLPLTELNIGELSVNGFQMKSPNYSITLDRIHVENMNRLIIDSLRVTPLYSKKEFAQKAGFETDRMVCLFPSIEVDGINHESLFNNELAIHKISLSFMISAFRDKRIKDRRKFKALPDSLLRKLPFAIVIDSIKVTNSQVTYEEFGEEADSAGLVQFKKVEALVYNISNKDPKKAFEITANAQFMNDGEIGIHGVFSNSEKPHLLEGSLKNFRLSKINRMLKPSTGVGIESGKLELMKFSFLYNNIESDGELQLNYHDLKLTSFRKNNKDKAVPAVAKTFLINAFVENDLDKNDSRSKRTGTIHFVRDKNKFIFNFWWKSLLSGLKSAAGVPETKQQASS